MKKYCKNCKYCNMLHMGGMTIPSWRACSCDYIISERRYDTPFGIETEYTKKSTDELNKNNDCKYYKPNIRTMIVNIFRRK